jgi:hypothetical protein
MVHPFILVSLLSVVPETAPSDFLARVRIVEARPAEGALAFVDPEGPEGEVRTLREGEVLEEAGGALVEDVGRATLVLRRAASGADGERGEALIVVRFDRSGKTRVREYRTVPDASRKPPRP